MKQTLKDFLFWGLNKLEVPHREGNYINKYQANYKSDFDGTYFRTKNEARAVWRGKYQEEKEDRKEIR